MGLRLLLMLSKKPIIKAMTVLGMSGAKGGTVFDVRDRNAEMMGDVDADNVKRAPEDFIRSW